MKQCSACHQFKSFSEFHKKHNTKDGYHLQCKTCRRKYYDKNKIKFLQKRKERHLKDNYGLTPEDYQELYNQQDGLCAICGKPETMLYKGKLKLLSVDHNHITGGIRKLLCSCCNTAIGLLHEDLNILRNMVSYIESFKE